MHGAKFIVVKAMSRVKFHTNQKVLQTALNNSYGMSFCFTGINEGIKWATLMDNLTKSDEILTYSTCNRCHNVLCPHYCLLTHSDRNLVWTLCETKKKARVCGAVCKNLFFYIKLCHYTRPSQARNETLTPWREGEESRATDWVEPHLQL